MSDVIKVIAVGPPEYRDISPGGEVAEGRSVVVWLSATEIARLLGAYAPQNASSPLVGDCRPLAREILDAFLAEQ